MADGVVELITSMKESLEREIHGLEHKIQDFRQEVITRFDRIEARMDRQGGLLRSGQTNIVRLNDWSEKVDQLFAAIAEAGGGEVATFDTKVNIISVIGS